MKNQASAGSSVPSRFISARWIAIAILAFTVLVRGGWIAAHMDEFEKDTDSYIHLAENVAKHGIYGTGDGVPGKDFGPTACRPPLYPLLLAAVSDASGEVTAERTAALSFLLGLGTVACVWMFLRIVAPDRTGLAAIGSLLSAANPVLLYFSSQAMTETPAAFLSALICWLFALVHRSRSLWPCLALGVALGLAALCRTTFILLLPVAAIGIAWLRRDRGAALLRRFMPSAAAAGMLALGSLLALGPWAERNRRVFGHFIPTTSHGGYALAVANSPDYFAYVRSGRAGGPWELERFDIRIAREHPWLHDLDPRSRYVSNDPLRELEMDKFFYRLAGQWIAGDPAAFLMLTADRFVQFWKPMPAALSSDESAARFLARLSMGVWESVVLLSALVSCWMMRRKMLGTPWAAPLAVILLFTAIHLLFWSNLRMRAPVMPCISVLAAIGIEAVAAWCAGLVRRRRPGWLAAMPFPLPLCLPSLASPPCRSPGMRSSTVPSPSPATGRARPPRKPKGRLFGTSSSRSSAKSAEPWQPLRSR